MSWETGTKAGQDQWADAQSRAIRHGDNILFGYGPSSGLGALKSAIVSHVKDSRGIGCAPEQIIVTSGAQHAFSFILMTLLNTDSGIWMEDPGHIAFRDVARLQGYHVRSIPLDSEGFSIAHVLGLLSKSDLIFVTPSHQHPLGMTMSLIRRLELLDVAQTLDSWIIEDDYDSEFHYEERTQPALKALDKQNRVLYVGSFSKSIFPAMRLGYIICPPGLERAFAAAGTLHSQNVSPIQQKTMASFMEDGSFNAHIRRMRSAYKGRRDILMTALEQHAAGILLTEPCHAGLHLVTRFHDTSVSDLEKAKGLWTAGIDCLPLSIFRDKADVPPGLLLGFACAPEGKITEKLVQAVQVLKHAAP